MARTTPVNAGYSIINGVGTGTNGYRIDVWIEYAILGQSIANNTTEIIAQFYACLNPSYDSTTYGGNGCYSALSVNGVSGWNLKNNGAYDFRNANNPVHLGSYQGTITHNADGTKTINANGSFTTSSSWITGGNVSGNITFPTIPRATTPGVPAFTMGSAGNIDLSSRASAGFTHTLVYQFGTASGTIASQTAATSVSWTPPESLAQQVPTATSGAGTITCHTYSGGVLIGTSYVNFTLYVPASIVPTISALGIVKNSANAVIAAWNRFVNGYSTATLTGTAAGAQGSSIASYYFAVKKGGVTVFSASQAENAWTCGLLSAAGTDYTFSLTVTDTRGRTATYTSGAYTVFDYAAPAISLTDVFRCLVTGVKNDMTGTYISAKGSFSFSGVDGQNTLTKKIEYRKYGDTTYLLGQNAPADATAYVFGGGGVNILYSYEVRFTATDLVVGAVTYTVLVNPAFVTMHIRTGGKGIGFGGAADADEFQVRMAAAFKENVNFTAGKNLKVGTDNVWHAGNDGTGSTLDADLLDGQHAGYFWNAGNYNPSDHSTADAWHYLRTPYGYISLGPANAGYAHIYTDRAAFYFNTPLYTLGNILWNQGNHPQHKVLLWSGWWSSGNITIASIDSYKMLEYQCYGTENRILAFVNPTYILGIGGNGGSAAGFDTVGMVGTRSGATLFCPYAGQFTHVASGHHSAATQLIPVAIYGLV